MSNLNELLRKNRNTCNFINEIKKVIYKDCVSFIKNTNNLNITEGIYTVPVFLVGYPLYDVNLIIKYLCNKLKKEKLQVKIINQNELTIKWG